MKWLDRYNDWSLRVSHRFADWASSPWPPRGSMLEKYEPAFWMTMLIVVVPVVVLIISFAKGWIG